MTDPWTLYWQSDCLDSCIAAQSPDDAAAVRTFWASFAEMLPADARVLDLATGNGTVPMTMLAAKPDLAVTAIDRADIDPMQWLSSPGNLQNVDFRANVDVESLPFENAGYDAVTSQFGIEYAALDSALAEAARVARRGAALGFVLHHSASEIVTPARAKRAEMDALLKSGGVLAQLGGWLAGDVSEAELDATGRAHLGGGARLEAVTGQIFEGVNHVIQFVEAGRKDDAHKLQATMVERLGADRDRLHQLDEAALDAERFAALCETLVSLGASTHRADELRTADGAIIGWAWTGQKA